MRRAGLALGWWLALVLGAGESASVAGTIPAASCAYADVNAAVTAAGSGDTVLVPAGTCTWSTALSPVNKFLTIQGAGPDVTTVIQGNNNVLVVNWTTIAGGLTRLTGFTFQGHATPTSSVTLVQMQGVSGTTRLDHNRFLLKASSGISAVIIKGYVRGVGDHNTFDLSALNFCCGYYVHHNTWSTPGTDFGDVSWAAPDSWGTDQAWYWETNTILYDNTGHPSGSRHAATSDGWQGSRVVNRFNTYTNVLLSGGHGTDTGQRWRGRRQTESYHETLIFECATCGGSDSISPAIAGRGGSMFVFDNTITAANGSTVPAALQLAIDRFRRVATSYQPWTYCGETAITSLTAGGVMTTAVGHGIGVATYGSAPTQVRVTGATGPDAALYNGIHPVLVIGSATQATLKLAGTPAGPAAGTLALSSPFDGNTSATGYPCLDQAGYGQSDLLVGTNPSPVGWPHQVLTPNLYWHNTLNGVLQAPMSGASDGVVLDREYHTDATIARGRIADRPASCTPETYYWATDEGTWNTTVPAGTSGKLYQCRAANQWTAWYGRNNASGEPLVYPHPLVDEGAPPEPVPPAPTVTVTLRFDGGGAGGTIRSEPPGIDTSVAGATSAAFPAGTEVVLRATPKSNNTVFAGWDGVCAPAGVQPACTIGLAGDTAAGARFVK
jgi:hypothetical protein